MKSNDNFVGQHDHVDEHGDELQPNKGEQHLHPSILKAILDSEEDGGVWLKDVGVYNTLEMKTKHTLYEIKHDPEQRGQWLIKGVDIRSGSPAVYAPIWTKISISGSTFGGSMLKVGYIGVGMYLEFIISHRDLSHAIITTSQIQEVWIK